MAINEIPWFRYEPGDDFNTLPNFMYVRYGPRYLTYLVSVTW